MTTTHDSAQIALGKFYLHRWEGQVLVDWATSLLAQGVGDEAMRALSAMEGATRSAQLDQFLRACASNDIRVVENMELSVRAYCEDLRRRALAGEIDLEAAFAQLRPLAYDNSAIVIPGLTELDEDFNLLDSLEPPYHHTDLDEGNRQDHLRLFFANLRVEEGPWSRTRDPRDPEPSPRMQPGEIGRYLEMAAVLVVTLLLVLYLLSLLSQFMVQVDPYTRF